MAIETRKPTAAIAPFGLRMQPELRSRVEAAAEAGGRSMNAEIVARLEESFALDVTVPASTNFVALIESTSQRIAESAISKIVSDLLAHQTEESKADAHPGLSMPTVLRTVVSELLDDTILKRATEITDRRSKQGHSSLRAKLRRNE